MCMYVLVTVCMGESVSVMAECAGSVHLLNGGTTEHQQLSDVSTTTTTTPDDWEIDPRHVALGVEIGQGAFGRVLTGFYRDQQVAIKVLKEHVADTYRDDLLREVALMKSLGQHSNIVSMVGACTARRPIALIMEYIPYGNLQNFLQRCRRERELESRTTDRDNMTYCLINELTGRNEHWTINATDVMSFARQVALAMEYLAGRNVVHRDLAARNVLLGYNKVVKVCDFGLARIIYTGDQYCKLTSGRLPLKWMSIESIRDRVFTTHSDVWSYGVLLWEIVTMGASPYPNIALADVYRLLCEGFRMLQPKNCSDELYEMMSQCWAGNPSDRPTFTRLRHELETLLSRDVTYLELDDIDAPLAAVTQSAADDDDNDVNATSASSTLIAHQLRLDVC